MPDIVRHLLLFAATLGAATLLGGCGHETAPTPPLTLPVVERPTLILQPVPAEARVLVPAAAVTRRGGVDGVFVTQDGLARFRMVRVGKRFGDRLEILSGLDSTETLVLGDLADVRDGSPIKIR